MSLKDELNNKQPENLSTREFEPLRDNPTAPENVATAEFVTEQETIDGREEAPQRTREQQRQRSLTMLEGTLGGVIGAAVIGMTSLINVSMNAEFVPENMEYRDGSLYYTVNVENMTDKETLSIYWNENGETIEKYELVDDDGDGLIEGSIALNNDEVKERLNQNKDEAITYSFALKGVVGLDVERSFDNYDMEIRYAEARIGDISMRCDCGVSGYYLFTIDFDDPYGVFDKFEAHITTDSAVVPCEWSENKHETQRIYVANLPDQTGKLHIEWYDSIQNKTISYDYDVRF